MTRPRYPAVLDPNAVGRYPVLVGGGGGYVWDEVLEYRVWCHPARGSDYFYAFASYADALEFSTQTPGAEEPLALILQREYISEPEPGLYIHIKKERMAEWPVEFLTQPRRTPETIPNFLSPSAPGNRLDILRRISTSAGGGKLPKPT